MEKLYQTDLSDAEWSYIEPHLPAPKRRGRPRVHSCREILNAIFYLLKTGCQWRMLPREYRPFKTVFHYFRQWRLDGIWEKLNSVIRRRLRVKLGRNPEPSAGMVDSQSAKTTGVGGEHRGYDGGKKVNGRKRQVLVDTEGLEGVMNFSLETVVSRHGYSKIISQRCLRRGVGVRRKRWIVERSFAWVSHNRRMSKDYEALCSTGEMFVYAAMTRLMVRRLACV